MLDPLASPEPPKDHGFLVPKMGRNYKDDMLANSFFSGVTKHPYGALIPASDNPIETFTDDRIVRGIHNGSQCTVCSLCVLSFTDVEQHVDAAHNVSFRIAQQPRIGHEPDLSAVGPLGDGFRTIHHAA